MGKVNDNKQSFNNFNLADFYPIYNNIKTRKIKSIEKIEELIKPLLLEHPELSIVLDIINEWKPKLNPIEGEGSEIEGRDICQSFDRQAG